MLFVFFRILILEISNEDFITRKDLNPTYIKVGFNF